MMYIIRQAVSGHGKHVPEALEPTLAKQVKATFCAGLAKAKTFNQATLLYSLSLSQFQSQFSLVVSCQVAFTFTFTVARAVVVTNFLMSNVLRLINICVFACAFRCYGIWQFGCHDAMFLIGRRGWCCLASSDPTWPRRCAPSRAAGAQQLTPRAPRAIAYFIKLPNTAIKRKQREAKTTAQATLFCHNNSLHKMLPSKKRKRKECENRLKWRIRHVGQSKMRFSGNRACWHTLRAWHT